MARNPPLICGPCVHTGHQNNPPGDRESLNKSTGDLGEYFGAEGSRSGVGALKALKKKIKLEGRCGTVSVAQAQCLNLRWSGTFTWISFHAKE